MNAQNSAECKVLLTQLSGQYNGECKKGLANGIGEAIGTDRYTGSFKKGLPNGTGVYYYSTGAVYEGNFLNGKRHGQGKLVFQNEGTEMTEEGIWEEDNYIGKKPEPAYEIIRKQNVLRYTFVKTNDPRNNVMIKLVRNGTTIYPENLMLLGSSGSVIQQRAFTGFEQLTFPFTGNIKYSLLTPFNNSYIDYEIEFLIREAGSWEITLSH
jgi:hypothetical protein